MNKRGPDYRLRVLKLLLMMRLLIPGAPLLLGPLPFPSQVLRHPRQVLFLGFERCCFKEERSKAT